MIYLKKSCDNIDFKDAAEIMQKAFSGRKIDDYKKLEKAFKNSLKVLFAFDNNRLIGFSRAVGDKYRAIIYNVALDPSYQGKGIGKLLIKELIKDLGKRKIYAFTHPRTVSLYESLGFLRTLNSFKYIKNLDEERIEIQKDLGFFKSYESNKKIININYQISDYENHKFNNRIDDSLDEADFKSYLIIDNRIVGACAIKTDKVNEGILTGFYIENRYRYTNAAIALIENALDKAIGFDIFINDDSLDLFNGNNDFICYKTAFYYTNNKSKYLIPKGFRYDDELNNEEMKYYKGKIYD